MAVTRIYLWQKIPVLRLLIPLSIGILVQWYASVPTSWLITIVLFSLAIFLGFFFLALKSKFRFAFINGICVHLLIASFGAGLIVKNDIRNDDKWFGRIYKTGDFVVLRLLEPLVEKPNSFKALADVQEVGSKNNLQEASGKVVLYFKKNSATQQLTYGSQIVINKELKEIRNSGNPGSFNYHEYCLFQGITHQVSGLSNEFVLLPETRIDLLDSYVFTIRENTIAVLQKYITSAREAGLAEALIIGYKNDLDKDLVQAYSNTGVVHIIAISGLHLGLIYWLLKKATFRLQRNKKANWIRVTLIISALWVFSLVAGAQPSVVRSAVMFTCLVGGELFNKKTTSINSLLFSAFLLLCYNPFWLWDVGFQLSYSAVLSLIIFYKPIYNWIAPASWLNKKIWGLIAATLAAQIITLPLVLYHFHQFPLLFLIANVFAVPVSSGILLGELLLLLVSFFHPVAVFVGWLLQKAITIMNMSVEWLSSLPHATWSGFSLSVLQVALLYVVLGAFAYWLIEQNKKAIWTLLASLAYFVMLRSFSFTEAYEQKEMIVYDVPKHQAIDLIEGRSYHFVGDQDLLQDDFIRNFHLQPSRVLHRITPSTHKASLTKNFSFGNKRVMIIDSTVHLQPTPYKETIDVVVLSKNPKLYISQLASAFSIKQLVVDASVSNWKKKFWKQDCDSLGIPYYDVADKGAFVMKIQ